MLHLVGVNVPRFMRRWGLEAFTSPCPDCSAPMTTTVPYAQGAMRGLVAPRCACGSENIPYCIAWDTMREPAKRPRGRRRRGQVIPIGARS
jgi:hypothetical protein